MSGKSSGNASSQGSNSSLVKIVEQLIESDEQEKNNKKIITLKNDFPVLKKIHSFLTNTQKLHIFFKDHSFKCRVQDKLFEKGLIGDFSVIIKVYLVSTRYGAPVCQQFDLNDLMNSFQRFGQILQIEISHNAAYIWFQNSISAYIAVKILNAFDVSQWLRMMIKFCNEQQIAQAYYLLSLKRSCANLSNSLSVTGVDLNNCVKVNSIGSKYIAKFQLEVENLVEFNLAQRLIGPRGSYMKKIIEKVISNQPNSHKYNLNTIQNVLKIRFIGKGTNDTPHSDYEEKSHIFISCKERLMYQNACKQIQGLLAKVLEDYKLIFQKLYHRYAQGVAYRILQFDSHEFVESRHVNFEQIENKIDLLTISKQPRLNQKIIQEKIEEREKYRKEGKFNDADKIRNWLRSKGVMLIDPKSKGKKPKWQYII